jgi:hypothetical protein
VDGNVQHKRRDHRLSSMEPVLISARKRVWFRMYVFVNEMVLLRWPWRRTVSKNKTQLLAEHLGKDYIICHAFLHGSARHSPIQSPFLPHPLIVLLLLWSTQCLRGRGTTSVWSQVQEGGICLMVLAPSHGTTCDNLPNNTTACFRDSPIVVFYLIVMPFLAISST